MATKGYRVIRCSGSYIKFNRTVANPESPIGIDTGDVDDVLSAYLAKHSNRALTKDIGYYHFFVVQDHRGCVRADSRGG